MYYNHNDPIYYIYVKETDLQLTKYENIIWAFIPLGKTAEKGPKMICTPPEAEGMYRLKSHTSCTEVS